MEIYVVWGKSWPLNYPFAFFKTRELAQESIDKSPDYQGKLEIKSLAVNETSIVFAKSS